MMRLTSPDRPYRATLIGAPAARVLDRIRLLGGVDRGAQVHSVFRSAINVAIPDEAGLRQDLVVLAPATAGGLPNGVLLHSSPPLPDLRTVGLRVRARVEVRAAVLHVRGSSFAVDLAAGTTWSPGLVPIGGDRWPMRAAHVRRLAASRSVPGGVGSHGLGDEPLADLARAVTLREADAATAAARRLIGLGPGLTPSGDDVLAGIEAALHAVCHPLAGFLALAIDDVEERTTDISATLLRHAARGEFAQRIHELLRALLTGPMAEVPAALDRAMAWGATSGSDTVEGVLLGLDTATLARPVAA